MTTRSTFYVENYLRAPHVMKGFIDADPLEALKMMDEIRPTIEPEAREAYDKWELEVMLASASPQAIRARAARDLGVKPEDNAGPSLWLIAAVIAIITPLLVIF